MHLAQRKKYIPFIFAVIIDKYMILYTLESAIPFCPAASLRAKSLPAKQN